MLRLKRWTNATAKRAAGTAAAAVLESDRNTWTASRAIRIPSIRAPCLPFKGRKRMRKTHTDAYIAEKLESECMPWSRIKSV